MHYVYIGNTNSENKKAFENHNLKSMDIFSSKPMPEQISPFPKMFLSFFKKNKPLNMYV